MVRFLRLSPIDPHILTVQQSLVPWWRLDEVIKIVNNGHCWDLNDTMSGVKSYFDFGKI